MFQDYPIDLFNTTLRKLYTTPWNPWTLVETLDKKAGQRFKES
jgi:hypothetical protein